MKRITITITDNAEVSVETTGYTGGECEKATARLEAALGGAVSNKRTPEFYSQAQTVAATAKA
jgi:hypothetical protein